MERVDQHYDVEAINEKEVALQEGASEELHFIEDLENRRNASGLITTMAIGEEGGGGWW